MAEESAEPSVTSELSVVQKDGVTIVTVQTENLLGLAEVNRAAAQFRGLLERGDKKLIVDLGRVQYVGSAALGMLLSVDQELKSKGGKLALVNVGRIETLLKISRTRGVFTVAPDVLSAERLM